MPLVAAVLLVPMTQKPVPPTPNDGDIPKPGSVAVGLAGSAEPDVVRYLNVRSAGAASLSPDGTQVAYRTSTTGSPQIWVVPTNLGAPVRSGSQTSGGVPRQVTFGEPISTHRWSPAGDWIFYGCDRGGNEREGYYLVSPDGTRERELLPPTEAFRQFGGFSPDGKKIAYTTTGRTPIDFDLHLIDIDSGKDELVKEGKGGLTVASWRPDGGALLLSEIRGEDANDVYMIDLTTKAVDKIFVPAEPAAYGSFAWKRDGSGFYLTTNEGREFEALCYYDVASKKLTVVEAPEHDVEQAVLTQGGTHLVWVTNESGFSTMRVTDLRQGTTQRFDGTWPPGVSSIGVAESAARPTDPGVFSVVIVNNSPGVPGDVWIADLNKGKSSRVTESSLAGLDSKSFVAPTALDFKARDGVTLHGLLYMPAAAKGVKPAVLLSVHGGPTAQARPSFNPVHQYLLARGIAIFDLNFRGSTGFGKAFARLDNGRLRPNAVLDMADALAFLEKDGRVDAKRAAVMGGSYGGYLTYAALTQLPDLFRSGVSIVGVSNWVTALEQASPTLKASDRLEYGNIDDPEDRKFFVELSPITHIKNVKAPIMVLHGANDPRDPPTESDQFVRGVRELGGEVEYLRFPDEGHGIRKLANRITAYRRVAKFLERTLTP
jgi:dipeptidyl aminopeptidase/acylaminoacyl peptidase